MCAMSATITKSHSLDGKTYAENQSLTANRSLSTELSAVPQAYSSTLTTKTNNTSGSLTLPGGHNVTTGSLVDIYWVVGGVNKCAFACTVGTVSGNTVPISSVLGGDALPASSTAVVVALCQVVPLALVGNNLVAILMTLATAANAVGRGVFTFVDGSAALLLNKQLNQNTVSDWYTNAAATNPLAGVTVANVYLSHNVTTAAQAMRVGALTN